MILGCEINQGDLEYICDAIAINIKCLLNKSNERDLLVPLKTFFDGTVFEHAVDWDDIDYVFILRKGKE